MDKEYKELFSRAGVILSDNQWRLIEQQIEIDKLAAQIEQLTWGRKTNLVTFEE